MLVCVHFINKISVWGVSSFVLLFEKNSFLLYTMDAACGCVFEGLEGCVFVCVCVCEKERENGRHTLFPNSISHTFSHMFIIIIAINIIIISVSVSFCLGGCRK